VHESRENIEEKFLLDLKLSTRREIQKENELANLESTKLKALN